MLSFTASTNMHGPDPLRLGLGSLEGLYTNRIVTLNKLFLFFLAGVPRMKRCGAEGDYDFKVDGAIWTES